MPLVAADDTDSVTEDAVTTIVTGNVGTNDIGGAGPLTVTAVNGSAGNVGQIRTSIHGTMRINADGSYTYTLNNADTDTQKLRAGEVAVDSFTYTIFDGTTSSSATIRVSITGANDLPNAVNDSKSVRAGLADVVTTGQVLTNDSDPETTLAVSAVNGVGGNVGAAIAGTYGTLTLNANGTYTYIVDADDPDTQAIQYYGSAQEIFTYTVSDGDGGTDTANLTINISGADRPVVYETTAEAMVNGTTAGAQDFPASASLASGGYVVTWLDSGTPGNVEIRGQLYDAAGARVGAEFLVNGADAVSQLAPDIVALDNGGFVAVWALEGGGVEAQIFSDAGARVGAKIVVASGAGETTPDVGALSNGNFVIGWLGQVSGNAEVKAQIYDATGATVGSQLLVDSAPAAAPLVAGLTGGGFVIAQASGVAQLFDNAGAEVGGQFRVSPLSSPPLMTGVRPEAITALADGGFVVTYAFQKTSGPTDSGIIAGQVFDANGSPAGAAFTIPGQVQTIEAHSAIAALPDGGFVVTWRTGAVMPPYGPDTLGIHGLIYDALGNPIGRDFLVNDLVGNPGLQSTDADFPAVTVLASGDIVFNWSSGTDILGQHVSFLAGQNPQFGTSGDDVIHADLGNSGLFMGLAGNDTYYVDETSDRVIERFSEGTDIVLASASYVLATSSTVETLATQNDAGTAAISLTGNNYGQTIRGNAGANFLNGGGGFDILIGLGGDDSYFVDGADDLIVETAGQGYDTVYVASDYVLSSEPSIEVLSAADWAGTAPLVLTGNGLNNVIYGNAGDNVLNGGGGADALNGLGGNDVYFLYNAAVTVAEAAGAGFDTIYTAGSYTLGAGVHVEILSALNWASDEALNLTGNALDNRLYGNAGANVLTGGDGNDWLGGLGGGDTLVGGAGDDVYWISAASDAITETAGNGYDTAYLFTSYTLGTDANVEVVSTFNWLGAEAINLTGNGLSNSIYGNAGVNILNGGAGADLLVGFGGADTFAFTTALGGGNVDTVSDFVHDTDKIALDDAVFTAIGGGALSADAFVIGAGAGDATDRIIYNSATGALFYDADGNGAGAAVQFATLSPGLALTASDFMMI